MDLMGLTRTESVGGKRYIMVVETTSLGTLGSFSYDPSLMILSTLKPCVQDCRMKRT